MFFLACMLLKYVFLLAMVWHSFGFSSLICFCSRIVDTFLVTLVMSLKPLYELFGFARKVAKIKFYRNIYIYIIARSIEISVDRLTDT